MLDRQKSQSPIEALWQRCRDWITGHAASNFGYCTEDEVAGMAHDIGVSAGELRQLASHRPGSADLLLRRMAALDLDENEIARTERATLQDLQRVCTMCECHGRCLRDLARNAADPAWKDYCPNADTLIALNALPWANRHEW